VKHSVLASRRNRIFVDRIENRPVYLYTHISRLARLDATAFLVPRIRSFVCTHWYARACMCERLYTYMTCSCSCIKYVYVGVVNFTRTGELPPRQDRRSFVSLSRSLSSSYPLKTKSALIYRGVHRVLEVVRSYSRWYTVHRCVTARAPSVLHCISSRFLLLLVFLDAEDGERSIGAEVDLNDLKLMLRLDITILFDANLVKRVVINSRFIGFYMKIFANSCLRG